MSVEKISAIWIATASANRPHPWRRRASLDLSRLHLDASFQRDGLLATLNDSPLRSIRITVLPLR